jgi:D-aminoacyl-tRNA deacylase
MRAVVQRVKRASVQAEGRAKAAIGPGLLVFLGVGAADTESDVGYMAKKIAELRIFEDSGGKMNLSLLETGGEMLVVSQFTLYGDCAKGRRPGFSDAARLDIAIPLYESFVKKCREPGIHVETGVFGAMMEVDLVNDGPVTMLLDSSRLF